MKTHGWTNYETWLVNRFYGEFLSERGAEIELDANDVKVIIEEQLLLEAKEKQSVLTREFVRASLCHVDWEELAEAYASEPILIDEF